MLAIRKATIKDAALLSQLLETSYRFHFSGLWRDQGELDEYIAGECSIEQISNSLETPDHQWFIAESRQAIRSDIMDSSIKHPNIIGLSKIILNQQVPDKNSTGIYLHKLHLMPNQTGKKYGDQLFEHIVKLGQEKKQKWLWLDVLEQNTSAIKFYARKGMKFQSSTLFTTPKQQSTMYLMARHLSD
ncbi:GNAT family N-acetyltransferase [Xenorhabdus sp. Sc-CR9]|uniref:GNAT family N-acetyltransferase n=1 Tax=Xenorhabdus sp. Sc-CR9 TaxID=2584468 RepID=UPI001F011E6D|nr:GNAT family N-acetyltransferase [Xenorhabdus sp. Sc-CR9]